MKVTVILCTYNSCRSLATAPESVAASQMPDSVDWEVLVVDNNSSDRTRAVVEEFCRQHYSRFRYLFEQRQGTSYALNTGIREARGEILAFMDDDVIVEPTWLRNLSKSERFLRAINYYGLVEVEYRPARLSLQTARRKRPKVGKPENRNIGDCGNSPATGADLETATETFLQGVSVEEGGGNRGILSPRTRKGGHKVGLR